MSRSKWSDIRGKDSEHSPEFSRAYEEELQAYQIGEKLRVLRQGRGISQAQLASQCGIAQPNISRLEAGTAGTPKLETLQKIAEALGLQISVLITSPTDETETLIELNRTVA